MKYLLDTDHISFLQLRSGPEYTALAARMALHPSSDFGFSVVSFHEQMIGAHTFLIRATAPNDLLRGYKLLLEILQGFSAGQVLPFDAPALAIFNSLRSQRIRISTMDLRIASIALSQSLIVLTRNLSDFGVVPGLPSEDWTK